MKSREFASLMVAGMCCILLIPVAALSDEPTRPNIILCMADDQGWEETGYNGHRAVKTPVLDEMARTGLRFDRFYSAAPNCGPTRGSIMTGRHSNRFGLFGPNWAMRPEEITLAEILHDAGYATGHFGKWHLGPVKAEAPNCPGNQGFDEWLSHDNFFEMSPVLSRNGAPPQLHEGESSEIVVDAAIEFMKSSHESKKPFLAVIWFGSPHGPYSSLDRDRELYKDIPSDRMQNRLAEITAMDRAIGKLRDSLRTMDVADETLFWYCSDNGVPKDGVYHPKLNGTKGKLLEGGIRVPGIIEWPSMVKQPRTTSVPCVTSDIMPTICDLLDLKLPDRPMDGISLVPVLKNEMQERPSPIAFWKYNSQPEKNNQRWLDAEIQKGTTPTTRNPGIDFLNFHHPNPRKQPYGGEAALMTNRHKLIISSKGNPTLYDLRKDPYEKKDLAADNPQLVKELTVKLRLWQSSVEKSLTGADYEN